MFLVRSRFVLGDGSVLPGVCTHAYGLLGGAPEAVFPIQFAAEPGLARGITEGSIPGFCSFPDGTRVQVDR